MEFYTVRKIPTPVHTIFHCDLQQWRMKCSRSGKFLHHHTRRVRKIPEPIKNVNMPSHQLAPGSHMLTLTIWPGLTTSTCSRKCEVPCEVQKCVVHVPELHFISELDHLLCDIDNVCSQYDEDLCAEHDLDLGSGFGLPLQLEKCNC